MTDEDLKLETTFSNAKSWFPYAAAGLAVAGIGLIILTVTTGIGAWLLPMHERYLSILIPTATDGSEALSLETLAHEIKGKTLIVNGTVSNRTAFPITGLQAVVDVRDRYTLPVVTVAVPIDPVELAPNQDAVFRAEIGMEKELGGYTVRFRLPEEGPFVPHKDERPDRPPPAEPQ
jgi:hypothetical protein